MSEQTPDTIDQTAPPGLGRLLRRAFGAHPEALSFPVVDSVQTHWDELRAGRTAPARAEIDPRPLAEALPYLFVAEMVAPGVARLRLCGQHLCDLMGMEPRGMPLSVFVEPEARDELAESVAQVAQGARVTLPLRAASGFARPVLDGQLALMPLTDAQGRITRILGVLESHGPIGRAPRRFALGAPIGDVAPRRVPAPSGPRARPPGRPVLRVIQGGRG